MDKRGTQGKVEKGGGEKRVWRKGAGEKGEGGEKKKWMKKKGR